MLGYDIAAALPEMRAHAESLMADVCVVTRVDPDGQGQWDEQLGVYSGVDPVVVYSGRCQLPTVYPNAQDADAGETNWAKALVVVKFPTTAGVNGLGDPLAVADGHTVTIPAKGLTLTVRAVVPQTYEKSRKVSCEVVTRDGHSV